ncbi:MAG: HEAT repeat domain-containing protein [Deltaproteobacteria bacterium]|nr:HEAT repeat domain-containing protein [Deltaproteobacteria bacterium]
MVRRRAAACAGALVALVLVIAAFGSAQDVGALHRTLSDSRDFRARVQTAFALGRVGNRSSISPLSRALRDSHPAVRAAAAVALGRIGDASALPALQRAQSDSAPTVRAQAGVAILEIQRRGSSRPSAASTGPTPGGIGPVFRIEPAASPIEWRRVQYLVVLGDFASGQPGGASPELAREFRGEVERQLGIIRGVAVTSQATGDIERQVRRHRVRSYRVDGSLRRVDRSAAARELRVRCEVSLLLATEPDRNLRGVMNGAATSSEPMRAPRHTQLARLERIALQGAVRGALARAPTVLAASDR